MKTRNNRADTRVAEKMAAEMPGKMAEVIVLNVLESALMKGEIDHTIINPAVLEGFLRKRASELNANYIVAIDHRNTLLNESRRFLMENKSELGLLLFATWTEHFVNNLIQERASSIGIPADEITEIIRSASIKAKLGGILRLLKFPKVSGARCKAIIRIMELRNAYVHYKWKYTDFDDRNRRSEIKNAVLEVAGLVKYLKQYEKKNTPHFPRKILRGLLRKAARDRQGQERTKSGECWPFSAPNSTI